MNVLLIDDELEFCVQAREYLENFGHNVAIETQGDEAFSAFERINPSIVVIDVDLGLKGLDGRSICAKIAQSYAYINGTIGIIMISGHYISPSDEVLGFQVGADNYLVKPFELSQLLARVNALSRRFASGLTNELEIDKSLIIDIAARAVLFEGTPINLTKLEYNVLLYLAQPPGTSRTKSNLLQSVWGTSHIEEGAIAKCVSLLRRKLCPDDPDRYIKTIYGVGYKLISSRDSDV